MIAAPVRAIDLVSYWSGKAFAWLIVALTFVVAIEVFKRYILNAPTAWIFDFNNMLYGTLFMMCGAYTLALAGHVRADFVYTVLGPRAQAALDLVLYLLFFVPGILGLIYAGFDFAALSWRIGEHSTVTAEGPPVYHFKSVIPLAGILVMLQGLGEIVRCVAVPAHRRVAGAPGGRRGDRRDRDPARPQRVRGRGVAPGRDGGRARHRRGGPAPLGDGRGGGAETPERKP